jgi:hypothetical protein
MRKQIEFMVNISDFDADAWKRLSDARSQVEKIEREISDAYQKSDKFKAVHDIAGNNDFGQKNMSYCRIQGSKITATTSVELVETNPATHQPSLNLGEKTVNTLLNGKLLTDAQKKALVKRLGVDLDTLSDETGAA